MGLGMGRERAAGIERVGITLSKFCLPSEKRSTLKGKNLLPLRSKFFPSRVDLFSEGK